MSSKNEIKITLPSSLENITLIRALIKTYLEVQKVDSKDVLQLLSVVDELATNVVEHGYEYQSGDILIEVNLTNDNIKILVEDNGIGFNDKKVSKQEGGMGLFLVKKLSDNFKIEKKVNGTIFKVEKKIRGLN